MSGRCLLVVVNAARSLLSIATQETPGHPDRLIQDPIWLAWNIDGLLFGLALCAVTMSIAVTEILLAGSLVFRVIAIARGRARVDLPRVFWFWLAWAILELVAWLFSPQPKLGEGEMRHLLLAGALFLLAPTLNRANWVAVWRGIVVTRQYQAPLVLIGHFAWQLLFIAEPRIRSYIFEVAVSSITGWSTVPLKSWCLRACWNCGT